jgi:hypothetical protein
MICKVWLRIAGLTGLLVSSACTESNAPDPGSPLGGWSYSFIISAVMDGQEVTCYETGSVGFTRLEDNSVSGFSGVATATCIPLGILALRMGRVAIDEAAVSQTSVSYQAEACAFTASTPRPSTGGPPRTGEGLARCRYEVTDTGDSVTLSGPFRLMR